MLAYIAVFVSLILSITYISHSLIQTYAPSKNVPMSTVQSNSMQKLRIFFKGIVKDKLNKELVNSQYIVLDNIPSLSYSDKQTLSSWHIVYFKDIEKDRYLYAFVQKEASLKDIFIIPSIRLGKLKQSGDLFKAVDSIDNTITFPIGFNTILQEDTYVIWFYI